MSVNDAWANVGGKRSFLIPVERTIVDCYIAQSETAVGGSVARDRGQINLSRPTSCAPLSIASK
jgi:hypothetical protein